MYKNIENRRIKNNNKIYFVLIYYLFFLLKVINLKSSLFLHVHEFPRRAPSSPAHSVLFVPTASNICITTEPIETG